MATTAPEDPPTKPAEAEKPIAEEKKPDEPEVPDVSKLTVTEKSEPSAETKTEPQQDGEKKEEATDTKDSTAPTTDGPTADETKKGDVKFDDKPEEIPEKSTLEKLIAELETITKETGHSEVWGINLDPSTTATKNVLQKFIRANKGDLLGAKTQLRKTLEWRKEFKPTEAVAEVFSKEKFNDLGYIVEIPKDKSLSEAKEIVTFNLYGVAKDYGKTFGDLDAFIRWRVALMELSVQKMGIETAEDVLPEFGKGSDPHQGIQVHDYKNVSFFSMDSRAKAASKKVIQLLADHYPETMARKFFVNVPVLMSWVYIAVTKFLSEETVRKFCVLSDSTQLSRYLGNSLPKEYGGEAAGIGEVGETLKLE